MEVPKLAASPKFFSWAVFHSSSSVIEFSGGGNVVVLEGVASGYWTMPATYRVAFQPLGFDYLALRGHSSYKKLIDNGAAVDTINEAGIIQYHSRPRESLGALAFLILASGALS